VNISEVIRKIGLGAIDFNHLGQYQSGFGLEGDKPRVGLRINIGSSGDDFWSKLRIKDKKLVADTERRERRIIKDHGDLIFIFNSDNPDADLDTLIELKLAQYTRTERIGAPLFDSRNVNLLRLLMRNSDSQCSALLSVLRIEDRIVSAHFGLCCYDTLHYWFPVYDLLYSAYSPGRILIKNIIINNAHNGIVSIDRGEGDTQAKRDFANEEHLYYRGLWTSNGLRSKIAMFAMALSWRLSR
jgi:CelD/BcsL family acetyltransferase involved in cellulose biosynthesis